MVKRFFGGVISATQPTVSFSSASGLYSLSNQLQAQSANLWPFNAIIINGTAYPLAGVKTFTTNGYYTVVVTSTMTCLIQLWGAGGGTSATNTNPGIGGAGGYVEGQITLTPGNYVFLVGQGGQSSSASTFPDGATVTYVSSVSSSGGGSTRFGPAAQTGFTISNSAASYNNTNAVYSLIAGGGGSNTTNTQIGNGGNGTGTPAGYGGGTTGAAGGVYYSADTASSVGGGGSQSAGGTNGSGGRVGPAYSGAKYAAGSGYYTSGGGGYYGGGGAYGYYSQSGGGSGFINSGTITNGTFYTATAGSSAYVSPDPRTNKPTNAGNGAQYGVNSSNGYDGAVIITWLGY